MASLGPSFRRLWAASALSNLADGVFQIALAYAAFVKGLKHVTATQASLTGMIEPVANPIWVALFLGERPSVYAMLGGAIVAVGSMSGTHVHAGLGAYGPSKAAVIMLVRVLAQEFGRDGIRVNAVSPGMTRTGMTARVYEDTGVAAARDALVPLGRVAMPEDLAAAIAFLLSPDARYVNGHDLVVDGGLTGNLLGRLPGLSQITRA